MLKNFELKVANLKAEVNATQTEAGEDFRSLNRYEEHLRWVQSQLKNSSSNSTRDELIQELHKLTDRIIFVKNDLIEANATHNRTRLAQD